MKTSTPTKQQQLDKQWYLIDAEDKVLGRLATDVASLLRGKNKATFTPHMDMGDHVVVINAEKIRLTGSKLDQKNYYRHSGHPGHLKVIGMKTVKERRPRALFELAVKGMLPKNKLRDGFMKKLHVYAGAEHDHEAQKPIPWKS